MKKNYFFTLLLTICFSAVSFGQVIITELADPNNDANARYVELYNLGNSAQDLTGWFLKRHTNGNAGLSTNVVDLTSIGSLASGAFAIIASNGTNFQAVYGMAADIDAGTGGPADSNGDDQILLYNASDVLVDIFGVPGEDGTGTCHEFEDGRAERKGSVSAANSTWTNSEWNVWADSTVNGCTSHTNSPRTAPTDFDPKAWIGTATSASISATSAVTGLDYFEGNGPSAEKTFSVEGLNLTADIEITAPTNFEISTTSGASFGTSISLSQTAGTVTSTTIYVRLISGLGVNTYSGDVTVTSAGASNVTVALSGEISPADPQFSSTAFLNDFNYVLSVGGPSAEQTFTVEGLFLTADLIVTAPTNFEVSLTSGANFANVVNITPTSGTISTTTIYVRLADGLAAGNYSGDITLSSTGVANSIISVNGNAYGAPTNSMVITGIYDGPLTGGTPKGVEIYVLKDVADLTLFGVSSAGNGGGSTAGNVEFSFPAGSATAGDFIYVSTDETNFNAFFGMNPTYTSGSMGINGDDAVELYESGQIIDVYGDVDNDFSGEAYDYLDGWAYRKSNTGPEGTTFTPGNWTYSGVDAFDGETTNATATTPFPIGTYVNTTASVNDNNIQGFTTYPNPIVNKEFTISSSSSNIKDVSIFNVLGKSVLKTQFSGTKSTIDVSKVNAGIYILKVTEDGKTATKKLVIR